MNRRTSFVTVLLLWISISVQGQQLTVATYNMRYDNKGDSVNGNAWKQRYPVIANLIRFHDFDIFGTQECLYHQLQNLQDSLSGYTYIGIGREDGKQAGEFSAIFYKTNKFRLLNKGNFWLSTITDRPNKGWDAALPRICTWGAFQDVKSGFKFYFFNLHMDHIGVEARKESAKLVLNMIKKIAGNAPVILTGDFNVDQRNESYALINTSGVLKDAYELSPFRYALNGTFNNFNINAKTDSRIDHIFLTKAFKVKNYGILTDSYRAEAADKTTAAVSDAPKEVLLTKYQAKLPSDHFPVMAEIEY